MRLALHEQLALAASQATRELQIEALRRLNSGQLRTILRYAYDPRITWILPDGDPPYKPLPADQQINSEHMLMKEARTLYLFVEGGEEYNPNVKPARREQLFVELLESVHPKDARLILEMKNRSLSTVKRDVADEAFPGLLGDERSFVTKAVDAVAAKVATVTGADPDARRAHRLQMKRASYARRKAAADAAKAAGAQQSVT